jgi:uncharacterized protein (TIRG00374 family)
MGNPAPVSRRKIVAGISMFLLLTAGGYAAVRWSAGPESESVVEAVSGANRSLLLLAALVVLSELAVGGGRFWILARQLRPGFSWRDGLQVNLYLMFAAGVTPMQLGAGPAQYLILRRKGLHGHDALAVVGVNWLGGNAALLILAGAGLLYLLGKGNVELHGLMWGLLAMVGVTTLAVVAATLFPREISRLMVNIRPLRRSRRGHRMVESVARYRGALREFRLTESGRRAWLLNLIMSIGTLSLRCLTGVIVLASLGVEADAVSVAARQILQFAVITVAPSPGGSGVAEVTTIGLMTGLVPGPLMLPYTVLWRFFTSYIAIAAGALMVAVDLFRSARVGRV